MLVERVALVGDLATRALSGRSVVLVGGLGTGKTIALRQTGGVLGRENARVIELPDLSTSASLERVFDDMADRVGVQCAARAPRDFLEEYLNQHSDCAPLIFICDHFDRYLGRGTEFARQYLEGLEAARRELSPRVGIVLAASLRILLLRDVLGSSFMSHAELVDMTPLTNSEIRSLASPLFFPAEPSPEVVATLSVLGGGNPAITAFALQWMWASGRRTESDVSAAFADFMETHSEFVRLFRRNLDLHRSAIVSQIWDRILDGGPRASRDELLAICGHDDAQVRFDLHDVLRVLGAAGVIRVTGSISDEHFEVRPIASILNLRRRRNGPRVELRLQLIESLKGLLSQIHSMSPDFFRSREGASGEDQVVQECVFSAFLVAGLRQLGWVAEREAIQGAGRTDIKVRHGTLSGDGVVEIKIWPRNDYSEIHAQVLSYCGRDTVAAAAVMVFPRFINNLPASYRQKCFPEAPVELADDAADPVRHIRVRAGDSGKEVDHLLLVLARR